MKLDDLSEEQKAKVTACKTADELVALAKEEGLELSDEQLDSISGGDWDDPICGDFCGWLTFI